MSYSTKETIKYTAISFAIYLAIYSVILIALLGILSAFGTEEVDFATLIATTFSSFPAMFAGNLLPFGLGYLGAKYYYENKVYNDYQLSTELYTLCAIIALEVLGTLFSGNIANVSTLAILSFLIYTAVKIRTLRAAFSMAKAKNESPEKYAASSISYDDLVKMAKMEQSVLKSSLKALKAKGVINKYQMALILHFGMVAIRDFRKKELERQAEEEDTPPAE